METKRPRNIGHKRRILFVLPSLMPGGAERVMITLMNDLDRTQFEPELAIVYPGGTLRDLINTDIPVWDLNHKGHILLSAMKLLHLIRMQKIDMVISTMAPMNFTVLLLKPLLGKTKIIVREAITPSYLFQTHPRLAPMVRRFYRWLYPLADRIISPSNQIMQEFSQDLKMDMKKHAWLPNPVNLEKIRALPPAQRLSPGLWFVSGGRLHPQKGYDRLIPALKGFNPGTPWALTILGEGPERANLESLILENSLSQNIFLSGHAQNPWSYYAAADAFLLSSRWEGLPNVVLESLACGTPVIAMKEAGGIEDIAKLAPQSVTTVPNINAMITAMAQVVPNPTQDFRQSLLPAAFNRHDVHKRFTEIILSA